MASETVVSLGDFYFPLEAGQVRRFAEASWDGSAAAGAASGTLQWLPPTYLGAAATLSGRPHSLVLMGFDVARSFHGTEVIEQLSPVAIGDLLRVSEEWGRLSDVRGRRGGLIQRAVRRSDFYDHAGELIGRTERVILQSETALVSPPPKVDVTVFDDGLQVRSDPVDSLAIPATSLQPGTQLPTAVFGPLTRTDFVRYASASGDLTAVHFDERAAEARGYPAPFAMGMLSAAFIGHVLGGWVQLVPPWRLVVRFREQVWPGEILEISGKAVPVGNCFGIDVECSGSGRLVTSASLEFGNA